MSRAFTACKQIVKNRGTAPDAFLNELIDWALSASDEIFLPNSAHDIYSSVVSDLGPWRGTKHRKAVMLEVLRVLGLDFSTYNLIYCLSLKLAMR